MLRARHKDLHPLLKVAEWLLLMLVCTLAVFAVWNVLPIRHSSTGALLLFQALQAIGLFIVPALAVAYLWGLNIRGQKSDVRSQISDVRCQKLDIGLVLLSIGIMATAIPLINCMVDWNRQLTLPVGLSGLEQLMQQMEEQADRLLQGFLTYRDGAWWILLLNLLVLAVLPAIGEELTFRGVLQSLFTNRHVAVWVTAFVFSFIHLQFYGFVARLLLGALLGYALVWSGRIGYSMIMHATNNALSVIIFYLGTYVWHLSPAELDALGTEQTWWLTLIGTPVMGVLILLFYKRTRSTH